MDSPSIVIYAALVPYAPVTLEHNFEINKYKKKYKVLYKVLTCHCICETIVTGMTELCHLTTHEIVVNISNQSYDHAQFAQVQHNCQMTNEWIVLRYRLHWPCIGNESIARSALDGSSSNWISEERGVTSRNGDLVVWTDKIGCPRTLRSEIFLDPYLNQCCPAGVLTQRQNMPTMLVNVA
jgi:hypothetical protein